MPVPSICGYLSQEIGEVMKIYSIENEKRTYFVFSFKRNEFNNDFYKGNFIIWRDSQMLEMIIDDYCRDDHYLQLRMKYNMSICFEYTAQTTLGEEIERCIHDFENHLATIFPPSPEMSEGEIESPLPRH